jgi:hypothetical protein
MMTAERLPAPKGPLQSGDPSLFCPRPEALDGRRKGLALERMK